MYKSATNSPNFLFSYAIIFFRRISSFPCFFFFNFVLLHATLAPHCSKNISVLLLTSDGVELWMLLPLWQVFTPLASTLLVGCLTTSDFSTKLATSILIRRFALLWHIWYAVILTSAKLSGLKVGWIFYKVNALFHTSTSPNLPTWGKELILSIFLIVMQNTVVMIGKLSKSTSNHIKVTKKKKKIKSRKPFTIFETGHKIVDNCFLINHFVSRVLIKCRNFSFLQQNQ